jgi:hypothetical protein
MSVEMAFWGLCRFVERPKKKRYDVYLPDVGHEHGAHGAHVATLAIPVKHFETDGTKTTWRPTSIIHLGKVQIACWSIEPKAKVELTSTGGMPEWSNPDETIQFDQHHKKNPAKSESDLNSVLGYPQFCLCGGTLTGEFTEKQPVKFPGRKTEDVWLARAIAWRSSADGLEITAESYGAIALKDGVDAEISVTNVTNLAGSGTEHFDIYYDALTTVVRKGSRIVYQPAGPNARLLPEVYDCVPPGGGS